MIMEMLIMTMVVMILMMMVVTLPIMMITSTGAPHTAADRQRLAPAPQQGGNHGWKMDG